MIWQPLKQEPGVLELRLAGAVRAAIARDPEGRLGEPPWQMLELDAGRALHVRLSATPVRRERHAGRSAVVYEASGQAVIDQQTFLCEGRAVLDLKTRAFLDVTCRLSSLGPLNVR